MSSPKRILMIEDNPGDKRLIEIAISQDAEMTDYEIISATRMDDALQLLSNTCFDLILLDLSLPDSFGIHSFTRLNSSFPNIPILVLTGTDDHLQAFDSLIEGAQNYLIKDQLNPELLCRSIDYALKRHELILKL
jgi:DNA-binding response OmpR family regulator